MPDKTFKLTYYPWITQGIDAFEVRQSVNLFATCVQEDLSNATGKSVFIEVLQAKQVPQQIDWIRQTPDAIALMNPLGFVIARYMDAQLNARVDAIAVAARRKILAPNDPPLPPGVELPFVPYYRAQIYANKRAPAGYKERSIAFGVSYSTSNFLVPAWQLLKKDKINPLTAFSHVEFLGGHDIVAKAVYDGRVDLGVGHDGVILGLARSPGYGDAAEVLRTRMWTDEIPSDPVAVNLSDPATWRAPLAAALISGSKRAAETEGTGTPKTLLFWGGVPWLVPVPEPEFYALLLDYARDLGLSAKDILGSK